MDSLIALVDLLKERRIYSLVFMVASCFMPGAIYLILNKGQFYYSGDTFKFLIASFIISFPSYLVLKYLIDGFTIQRNGASALRRLKWDIALHQNAIESIEVLLEALKMVEDDKDFVEEQLQGFILDMKDNEAQMPELKQLTEDLEKVKSLDKQAKSEILKILRTAKLNISSSKFKESIELESKFVTDNILELLLLIQLFMVPVFAYLLGRNEQLSSSYALEDFLLSTPLKALPNASLRLYIISLAFFAVLLFVVRIVDPMPASGKEGVVVTIKSWVRKRMHSK